MAIYLDLARLQLIACVTAVPSGPTRTLSCNFNSRSSSSLPVPYQVPEFKVSFDFAEGSYRVTVRTARTGDVRGEFSVPATASDQDSCPRSIEDTGDSGRGGPLLRGIDGPLFRTGIEPYVLGPA